MPSAQLYCVTSHMPRSDWSIFKLTMNTRGGHFSYFDTIGANPFRKFRAFREDNNNPPLENNNNNNPPLLLSLEFGEGLEEGFNLPPRGNMKRLDPNIAALVNALGEANLRVNHVKRESNHIKLIEFGGIEAEDPNR